MKHLVIIPSNQDKNIYADGRNNEMVIMHKLAEMIVAVSKGWRDLSVTMIPGRRESLDRWSYEGLYAQQAAALAWLRDQGASTQNTAIVNLHSDAGKNWPHVLGIYGGAIGGPSYRLADDVSRHVEDVFQTGDRRMWDYSAYIFYQSSRPYPAALIELGSHEHPGNMDILLHRQSDLAIAVLKGAAAFLKVAPKPEPVLDADEAYWKTFGDFPYNPEHAIPRYWRACRQWGDAANLGPPIGPEENGELYGEEAGSVVQRFTNAIVITKPSEGWKCYRAQVVLEPQRWGLCE